MSKELEALNEISLMLNTLMGLLEDIFVANNDPIKETIKKTKHALKQIPKIETVLKRLESLEQYLIKGGFNNFDDFIKQLNEYIKICEKEHEELMMLESQSCKEKLKAFEIIKEKGCLHLCIIGVSLEDYNNSVDIVNKQEYGGVERYKHYTQEEFDSLKKVML